MRPFADYHTHTRYSHGRGTIEDNVRAARARGLQQVAITDHGPRHLFIGIKGRRAFERARREVDALKGKYPDMEILLGVEANVISREGEIDVPDDVMPLLDLILVGYHLAVRSLDLPFTWHLNIKNRLWQQGVRRFGDVRLVNTRALMGAVRKYPVKIVTHPGLHVDIDTRTLAQVCRERGTALEINCSYLEETREFLEAARDTGVLFAVSSDAHSPSRVGDFANALELLEDLGISERRVINLR
jgi:putative hydrolase